MNSIKECITTMLYGSITNLYMGSQMRQLKYNMHTEIDCFPEQSYKLAHKFPYKPLFMRAHLDFNMHPLSSFTTLHKWLLLVMFLRMFWGMLQKVMKCSRKQLISVYMLYLNFVTFGISDQCDLIMLSCGMNVHCLMKGQWTEIWYFSAIVNNAVDRVTHK